MTTSTLNVGDRFSVVAAQKLCGPGHFMGPSIPEFRLPGTAGYLNNSGHSRQHLFHTMM